MTLSVSLTVNGRPHRETIDPRTTLLDLVRDSLGLTGAKKGCARGECGACTMLVDGRPILSCLKLAASLEGAAVGTIEGLGGEDTLHPVQQAFVDHDALQCGFCTSGQILAAVACIDAGHADSEDRIRHWMSGNLCRCAAYPQILAAIKAVATTR